MNKTIEICIGTDRAKHVRARLSLIVIDDNGRIFSEHYHSINIPPDADLAFLREVNETHLADPNGGIPGAPWPKIPDEAWADVEAHCGIVHKPEVVQAYRAYRMAEEKIAEAMRAVTKEK